MATSRFSKHIYDLPEEVLIEIFKHLAVFDLKKATLVSKYFNRMISSSSRLMNKVMLKLEMDKKLINDFLGPIDLTRQDKIVSLKANGRLQYPTPDEAKNLFNAIFTPLENSLTTLTLSDMNGFKMIPENMPVIASCKFIQTLIIKNCYCCWKWEFEIENIDDNDENYYLHRFSDESQHQRSEFSNLKRLELINSSSVILNFIGCKQLDKFSSEGESESFWKFFDQLERCDELELKIKSSWWTGEIPKLKFAWNKLKISIEHRSGDYDDYNENGLRRIAALCQASSPNAEVEVELESFEENPGLGELLKLVLSNCSRIGSLILIGRILELPITNEIENLSQKLAAIRKLEIRPGLLKDQNFVNFAMRLTNVTELKLLYACGGVKLSTRTLLMLQPFFDRITDLTVPDDFMEKTIFSTGVNHVKKIQINSLQSFAMEFPWSSALWTKTVVLRKFAQRHPTLRHLYVIIGKYVKDFSVLIKLRNQLRDTGISTCNVMIFSERYQTFINWRSHPDLNEMMIFGKVLNENENRFFV